MNLGCGTATSTPETNRRGLLRDSPGVETSSETRLVPGVVDNYSIILFELYSHDEWLRVDRNSTMTPTQCRSRREGYVNIQT